MRISHVRIKNFRNLTDISVPMHKVTTVIGNNDSGKSNFLKALTLPLLSDDIGHNNKNLSWNDIGNFAKEKYYDFIISNKASLIDGSIDLEKFIEVIPLVSVRLDWVVDAEEKYIAKEFLSELTPERATYAIEYNFKCKKPQNLFNRVKDILTKTGTKFNIKELQQNLLPMDDFGYSIFVPYKDKSISFDVLSNFKYNSIAAERDEFSSNNSKVGSRSLIQILKNKLSSDNLIKLEKEYADFFEQIKTLSNMEEILNWQDASELDHASDFFSKISILPNMPPMDSLLNSVKLGYEDTGLSLHGLGYRNLILQLVLMNSLVEVSNTIFSLLTIEEPEAHLCYRNEQIMRSYIQSLNNNNDKVQLVYSTHSTQFINKLNLQNVILLNEGEAISFKEEFTDNQLAYFSKNPNLDLFKLFYSKRCILVEGITEELLVKAYLNSRNMLSDIEVISFHKGYTKILDLWKKINKNTNNKIGIIRDYDNQQNAKEVHDRYDDNTSIFIRTTEGYTLEDDIVSKGDNYQVLKTYFTDKYSWEDIDTPELLSEKWKSSKAEVMLRFCQDIYLPELSDFELPAHIATVVAKLEVTMGEVGEVNED